MTRAVLFDFDGTLVDSAPVIIDTFTWVLAQHRVGAARPLDDSLIGPPLRQTLERLAGDVPASVIDAMAASFRVRYDSVAPLATAPYPGYAETLAAVRALGFALVIVTNKRIAAVSSIMARLPATETFLGVHALDSFDPPAADKRELVARVVRDHGLRASRCFLVGDTADDAAAAEVNGLRFIAALYGYGNPDGGKHAVAGRLRSLAELPEVLASYH
ncbi:MAG: HAD family hydrolase [Gemmatimonadaceae bacterium]